MSAPIAKYRNQSLAGRLTWYYVASTALLLFLATLFLYWALRRSLTAQELALASGKLEVVRLLLRQQADKPELLASEIEHEVSPRGPLRYYIRVLDAKGALVIETPGMADALPAEIFPSPPAPISSSRLPAHQLEVQTKSYLLLAAQGVIGGSSPQRGVLQIALDISQNDQILRGYRIQLAAMLGIGVLLSALLGSWVARSGLRPLEDITRATRQITASRLHERLGSQRWPRELLVLAGGFDEMLDRLQNSFNRLGQFTGDMAHALRNPINNLRGEAEVALARERSPKEYQHTLASSLEEHERLSRMIEAMLFIARADNAHSVLERVSFPIRREMEAVREFYDALASEQGVTVCCEGDALMYAEPILVRRAISNLLANALKHTPASGSVSISARTLDAAITEIKVRDTGKGIGPEHLPKVFDRFYQADPSRDQTSQGAGLGLAIVQSIMRLHGGTASIESTPGQGTTVTLLFPQPAPASISSQPLL
jgi:two-component system heavy metal sensor histidine kinase CusS